MTALAVFSEKGTAPRKDHPSSSQAARIALVISFERSQRFTAMPILITTWAGRPGEEWEAVTAAAIVVLLAVVLLANAVAILLRNRFEKKTR